MLTVNPKLKVLEFSSILKNGKTERFYYKYEKLSDKAVKMQKVNLATGASKYQEVAEARAFSYDMSFDIDTLKLESKVKTADAVVNCTTTYDLNQ